MSFRDLVSSANCAVDGQATLNPLANLMEKFGNVSDGRSKDEYRPMEQIFHEQNEELHQEELGHPMQHDQQLDEYIEQFSSMHLGPQGNPIEREFEDAYNDQSHHEFDQIYEGIAGPRPDDVPVMSLPDALRSFLHACQNESELGHFTLPEEELAAMEPADR
eukprot:31274_2